MRQYLAIKGQHADAILFFRMGDFYEMFFEDAVTAAKELDLTLTARDKNADEQVPLCGFPHHQLSGYLQKLLEKGYKVAVCDQTEDPKESRAAGKKLVERAVTRILTPGTVVDDEALEPRAESLLAAVARGPEALGVAFLEISTGALSATEVADEEEAWAEILAKGPRELVLAEGDSLAVRAERAVPPGSSRGAGRPGCSRSSWGW